MNCNRALIGKKISHLTILDYVVEHRPGNTKSKSYFVCQCDCEKQSIKKVECSALKMGAVKGCGCGYHRKKLPFQSSKKYLLLIYKKNSLRRKIGFNIPEEDFFRLTSDNCYYCGAKPSISAIPFSIKRDKSKMNGIYLYNGIDRIDNNKPYEIGNVRTCCSNM
jgi:hypothetical protein